MATLLEVLKKTEQYFVGKGLESPRLDAEILVGSLLGLKRLELYIQHDRPLSEEVLVPLRDWVRRRGLREPWQYLVGKVEFAGITLKTDRRALIPRPETEELVEMLVKEPIQPQRILDLGCGTGALGLSLAHAFPEAEVTLVDVCPDALALAEENRDSLDLQNRVKCVRSSWFDQVSGEYDWIVSNPPYLTDEEWLVAEPEVKAWEPEGALVGGEKGLEPYRVILESGQHYLRPGGILALETGIAMAGELSDLSQAHGWVDSGVKLDFREEPRFFFARKPA